MYPDTSRPIPDEDSLVALALEFNPSLKAAIMDMEARKAGERAVRFRKVPTLGGAFAYGYSDRSQFAGFDDWARHDFWRAGVYLEWTAFDGFQWWREAKQASLQTMLTRAEVEKTGGEVEEAMRTAFDQLRAARASLGYAAALENLSEQQLRLSKEKYELDAASELEVLGSRRAYMEAQQKRIQSIIAYRLARAKVMQLMGKW
jgi:outer membrane protein TolC